MTNNTHNLTPTGPGWWYQESEGILHVSVGVGGELFAHVRIGLGCDDVPVSDFDPDLWLGPVPKSGEWVPREQWDRLIKAIESVQDWDGTYVGECMYGPDEATP